MRSVTPILKVNGISKTFKRSAKFRVASENDNKEKTVLDAISFELMPGDVLGLIGNNGAGKSTLLKIISGLITPDAGEIRYSGRLASILEIGSGFHYDLTGRENIYMSGQLLGLSKNDVDVHIADIIRFSGQEEHLDVPVKYYSNGMFLRLAFSVATTFPSDILLLDEVMSVGDLKFQQESSKRIQQITKSGTTVILSSHELSSVQMLCNKVLLLKEGKIVEFGDPVSIIQDYLQQETFNSLSDDTNANSGLGQPETTASHSINPKKTSSSVSSHDGEEPIPDLGITVHGAYAQAQGKGRDEEITSDDSVCLNIDFSKTGSGPVILSAVFADKFGNNIMSFCNYRPASPADFIDTSEPGRYSLILTLPDGFFNAGLFQVSFYFADVNQATVLALEQYVWFKVSSSSYEFREYKNIGNYTGPLYPFGEWQLQ